jgi:hypothetical protein
MYQYEVVPIMISGGTGGAGAGNEWSTLRAGLNERGRVGFRVVAVTGGAEGRAVIMEREVEHDGAPRAAVAEAQSESRSARDAAHRSADPRGNPPAASPGEGAP